MTAEIKSGEFGEYGGCRHPLDKRDGRQSGSADLAVVGEKFEREENPLDTEFNRREGAWRHLQTEIRNNSCTCKHARIYQRRYNLNFTFREFSHEP